jgi:hypothetical protein
MNSPFACCSTCRCGAPAVVGFKPSVRDCLKCGAQWYENHCWDCKSPIDSRIHDRDHTGWYVCGECGASALHNRGFAPRRNYTFAV